MIFKNYYLIGIFLLFLTATNPVVAALGAANVFIYAVPYTLSKQHTEWNTWIGKIKDVKYVH